MDDFGPYRIHKELNRGATAVVYEAEEVCTSASANVWQATNSPPVALKVFNERPGGGFTIPISTIQQEIKCAASLRHQNIAQLLNVVPHRDRLGLVFELVRGPDLLDYTKKYRSKMPEELAIHYFRQMVAAVRHMHSNGTVHRDLKPENCMIDPCSHTLKVIDFGLASATSAQCLTGCGTINTMAPECIAMEGVPTVVQKPKAIDIWGLGVTLYIMLSGRYPFQDRLRPYCDESQKRNILNGRMNPLPVHISSSTRDLVRKLLRSSPDDRAILEDISRHPAMAMPGPIDSVFEEESQMFPQSDGMGSRISSYTSQVSDISPERLRPLTPPLSCDLSIDLDSETSQPNSPEPSSSKMWNVPKPRDFQHGSSSTGASPVTSRGWKNAGSLPKNWGSSNSFSNFSPSPMSTQAGFRVNTAFSPSQNYKSVSESFSKRQKSVPNMTTSRSNISLSSQLEMIEAALQEDDETDRGNYTGGPSSFFDEYDDSDMELGSEFDMGDKAQIGWSSSYSNPSSLSTPQPSLLNNSGEKDLRLSISDDHPSDSFDSASSLPHSPRDCLVQPSPVKLFSINSTDLVSKEDTNKEPSSSTSSTPDFVQHLPPVSTFQPLQPLKKLLSVVHEVPEEMEKEDLDDCEDRCDLAMASLSMQSDTTFYEM